MADTPPVYRIDARGFHCPVPTLKLRKALAEQTGFNHFVLQADDPMARIDVPHFCNENRLTLMDAQETEDGWTFTIHR
ncbi:MAG: sulfurtransferase TusA family protein [Asticcacaulis sp.]